MRKLHRLNIVSFAIFQAILIGLIGLLCGILYAFGGLIIDLLVTFGVLSSEAMSTPGLSIGTVFAFGALIGMPLIFVVGGFLLGVLEAFLYNLFQRWFGSLNINFE